MKAHWRKCPRKTCAGGDIVLTVFGDFGQYDEVTLDCPTCHGTGRIKVKASAKNVVNAHMDNPEMTPEGSHESWLAQKAAEGWKFGPVKNPETKEHPCFRPYSELPADQKAKDYLFKAVVDSLRYL